MLLWYYGNKKRTREVDDPPAMQKPKSRSRFENAYEMKMSKVEEVYQTLLKNHGKNFKPEQLRAWANMVQMQKHTSLEEPPTGRFFKTSRDSTKVKINETLEVACTTLIPTQPASLSPTKRVTLRTQCIEQIERWHQLMEKGAISKEQYDDLQSTILCEIKKY